ncbi:MAG: ATP-binding protein [Candidatus Thioglobus sp.]
MPKIIDAYLGLMALKQAGYRSTATAVGELIDNSIEAEASVIDIIAINKKVKTNGRASNTVYRIAVLDNGVGMDVDILENCLSLGWGTRLDTRDGLGRFGFGLKGASLSQSGKVSVYSWKTPGEVYMARLDTNQIKENQSQELDEVVEAKIPSEIFENFGKNILDSGTLIVWEELDLSLKRSDTLVRQLNKELCRIYRHFLDDDDTYGKRRKVCVHSLQLETKTLKTENLLANDPLYMLTPNNLPEHGGNNFNDLATNSLHDKFDIDVKYHNGISEATSKVGFRFSVAKPEIQALGGNSAIGKHYHDNTGISFVRAGREIDFGRFGFIDASDPRHRWWGVEIRFEPALDELFEITNNKQHVRGIHSLDSESLAEHIEEAKERNYKSAMLVQINKLVKEHISAMMVIIKGRGTGERSQSNRIKSGLKDRVNKVIEKSSINTESGDRAEKLTEDQKIEERVSLLLRDDSSLDEASAKEIAKESIDYKIDIQSDTWPGNLFLDRKAVANASVGIVNRNTKFYDDFWSYLQEHDDKKGFEALEVMMMALIRSEDELALEYDKKMFETYRAKWGEWIEKLLDQAT